MPGLAIGKITQWVQKQLNFRNLLENKRLKKSESMYSRVECWLERRGGRKRRERHTHGRYNREHFDVKGDEYVPSGNRLPREQSLL